MVDKLIKRDIPSFGKLSDSHKYIIKEETKNHIQNKRFSSKSFDAYSSKGTPATLFVDKNGFLRHKLFGAGHGLKKYAYNLLDE